MYDPFMGRKPHVEPNENEYLNKFMEAKGWRHETLVELQRNIPRGKSRHQIRDEMVRKYAWAIPNNAAIKELVKLSPLVEVGAGNGYWGHLISKAGGDICCYDISKYSHYWFPVKRGGPEKSRMKNRNLFLCWPGYYELMAFRALAGFKGEFVAYVGESENGCTGDEKFHELLDSDFVCVRGVSIPQWWDIHDRLKVYKRKEN